MLGINVTLHLGTGLANEPEEGSTALYSVTLNVDPQITSTSSVPITVTYRTTAAARASRITTTLPARYQILAADPPTDTQSIGANSWDDHLRFVSWHITPTYGVTETVVITVSPGDDSGDLYETIRTNIAADLDDHIRESGALVWVKVGGTAAESDVTHEFPEIELVRDYSVAVHKIRNQYGSWVTTTITNSPDPIQFPVFEPANVQMVFDDEPESNTPFQLDVVMENTVSTTLSYTGGLATPAGWVILAGQTSYSGSVTSGSVVTQTYTIRPSTITSQWTINLVVGGLSADATDFDAIHTEVTGGVVEGGGSWLGNQIQLETEDGSPSEGGHGMFLARSDLSGESSGELYSSTCPTCAAGTHIFYGKRVTGNITTHGLGAANLRVALWRYYNPGSTGYSIAHIIAETRTDANGDYEFVVCYNNDLASMWLRVVVYSTDELRGMGELPASRSVSVVSLTFPIPYIYSHGIHNMDDHCELIVNYEMSGQVRDPFYIATFYAYDTARFIQDVAAENPYSGNFPLVAYWPYYDEAFYPGAGWLPVSRCWEDCFINILHATNMNLMAHEYGHHTHYAVGGIGGPLRQREGFAWFQSWVQYWEGYMREPNLGETACAGFWLDCERHNGMLNDVDGAQGYFWDLYDDVSTEPDDLSSCDLSVADTTSTDFSDILALMGGDHRAFDLSEVALGIGGTPGFYELWPGKTDNMRAISFHHLVANDSEAEDACIDP